MSDTAEAPAKPQVQLKPVHNMHHTAYRCRDAEQTRWFYEDVLGFKLAAAMVFDEEPGSPVKREYMHLFFQTADGNFIAFFDAPDDVEEKMFIARHGFDQHIAFEVESMGPLQRKLKDLEKIIAQLETKQVENKAKFDTAYRQGNKLKMETLGIEYQDLQAELEVNLTAWDTLAEEITKIENK